MLTIRLKKNGVLSAFQSNRSITLLRDGDTGFAEVLNADEESHVSADSGKVMAILVIHGDRNHLLLQRRTALVATVADLTLRARACYDDGKSESEFLDELCRVDLLVIDEVGIQRESRGEKVLLNQIIDSRLATLKPVGILTNLNYQALTEALGERVIDRLQMDDGLWLNFDWESYRKNVSHSRLVK